MRLGELQNQVGDLYVDLRGIGDSDLLNAQVGRFQIPVGENYLRFGRGAADNPFLTNPVGGRGWWDEGVRVYGSGAEDRLGYVASVTDGETPFDEDADSDPQLTLKLFARPIYAKVGALRSLEMTRNQRKRLRSSITAEIRACGGLLYPEVLAPEVSEAFSSSVICASRPSTRRASLFTALLGDVS